MSPVILAENVYWVGAVDWDVRDFHGYETRRGTTYNAYLVIDEKTALIDTVKHAFQNELVGNIQELTSLRDVDYVVVNHVEKDHSSSLPSIMRYAKNATIVSTRRGRDGLTKYYGGGDWTFKIVETGDELNLGKRTLSFVEAPMLHWPDSMFTYLKEDEILMPNDAFGQHLASSQRFDDEVDQAVLMDEAAKYYANILMPFASLILKKVEELSDLGIEPWMIAPSHGVIWRSNPKKIVDSYVKWSMGVTGRKAVIIYDTMWGSTRRMAYAILDALSSRGVETRLLHIRRTDLAEVVKEVLEAKAVVVGSPTLNNSMLPAIGSFLTYIVGLRPKGKVWASFGSYGWGGGAVRKINRILKEANLDVLEPGLSIRYAPSKEELQSCKEFGEKIAEKIG